MFVITTYGHVSDNVINLIFVLFQSNLVWMDFDFLYNFLWLVNLIMNQQSISTRFVYLILLLQRRVGDELSSELFKVLSWRFRHLCHLWLEGRIRISLIVEGLFCWLFFHTTLLVDVLKVMVRILLAPLDTSYTFFNCLFSCLDFVFLINCSLIHFRTLYFKNIIYSTLI